ncbi:hypothetical protein [Alkalicoccobacillus murimartini]|nr:hypothetical protein [Alkalicoccobacillus murimartini]
MTYFIHDMNTRYDDILQKVFNYLRLHKQRKGYSPTIPEIANNIGDSEEMILESLEFGQTDALAPTILH